MKRFRRRKDSFKDFAIIIGVLLAVLGSFLYLLIAPWFGVPADTYVLPGLVALLTFGMTVFVIVANRKDNWTGEDLPAGWTMSAPPTPNELAELWQGDPPPFGIRSRKVLLVVRGQLDGRAITYLQTSGAFGMRTSHILIHLDGWLPQFKVWPQGDYLPKRRDATQLEDHELNQWLNIKSFDDGSTLGAAYAHAILTPRVMEVLLSRAPDDVWEIRGRFLRPAIILAPDTISSLHRRAGYLVRVADLIDSWVYRDFSRESLAARGCHVGGSGLKGKS